MIDHQKPKIALFMGSDIVAHREMVPAVKYMVENDLEPVLFYPEHKPSFNPNANQKMFRDYAYVERLILQNVVFPYIESLADNKPDFPSPQQIAARYRLAAPVAVSDINDPAFYEPLASDPQYIGSISMRCTQMFKPGITKALTAMSDITGKPRFLLNVHSGLLPSFRGLYATPRAIFETLSNPAKAKGEFGCTVHHVDPFMPVKGDQSKRFAGIDTGTIVDYAPRDIVPGQSVYATNIALSDLGADAVINVINKLMRGGSLSGYPQDNSKGRYFSYATPRELQAWDRSGLTMFTPEEVIKILVETFSDQRNARQFEGVVRDAISTHFSDTAEFPLGGAIVSSQPSARASMGKAVAAKKRTPISNDPSTTFPLPLVRRSMGAGLKGLTPSGSGGG